jgi:hypothetical protein
MSLQDIAILPENMPAGHITIIHGLVVSGKYHPAQEFWLLRVG